MKSMTTSAVAGFRPECTRDRADSAHAAQHFTSRTQSDRACRLRCRRDAPSRSHPVRVHCRRHRQKTRNARHGAADLRERYRSCSRRDDLVVSMSRYGHVAGIRPSCDLCTRCARRSSCSKAVGCARGARIDYLAVRARLGGVRARSGPGRWHPVVPGRYDRTLLAGGQGDMAGPARGETWRTASADRGGW